MTPSDSPPDDRDTDADVDADAHVEVDDDIIDADAEAEANAEATDFPACDDDENPWIVFDAEYDVGDPEHPAIELCYVKLSDGTIVMYHPAEDPDEPPIQSNLYFSVAANR